MKKKKKESADGSPLLVSVRNVFGGKKKDRGRSQTEVAFPNHSYYDNQALVQSPTGPMRPSSSNPSGLSRYTGATALADNEFTYVSHALPRKSSTPANLGGATCSADDEFSFVRHSKNNSSGSALAAATAIADSEQTFVKVSGTTSEESSDWTSSQNLSSSQNIVPVDNKPDVTKIISIDPTKLSETKTSLKGNNLKRVLLSERRSNSLNNINDFEPFTNQDKLKETSEIQEPVDTIEDSESAKADSQESYRETFAYQNDLCNIAEEEKSDEQLALEEQRIRTLLLKKGEPFNFRIFLKRTESLQSPLTPKGGVVVKSGDRCVAPAKSKPKKRTCLGSADCPPGMEHVEWSEEDFSVTELCNMFRDRFPIMVRVTQGYSSESGIEFPADQVLQIHSAAVQKRVIATDALGRVITIPLDYPVNVQVLDKKTNRGQLLLHDVIRTTSLPFRARVTGWVDPKRARSGLDLIDLELTFKKVVEEQYLRGNAIIDGWIDQMEVVVVPGVLGLELSVGLGLRGAADDEWKEYKSMFERTIRHLKFEAVRGFGEAVIVPEAEVEELNVDQNQRTPKIYENLNKGKEAPRRDPIYENLKGKKSPQTPPSPPRQHQLHESPRGGSRVSSASSTNTCDTNITQMFQSVLDSAEREEEIRNGVNVKPSNVKKMNIKHHNGKLSHPAKEVEHGHRGSQVAPTPKAVVPPTVQKDQGPYIVNVNVDHNLKHRNQPKSTQPRSTIDVQLKGGLKNEEYTKEELSDKQNGKKTINTVDDIPAELYDLSVEDVATCLELLNMEEYSNTFRKKQVDGGLLMDLDENVLQKEFKFTPFNSSKLLRFTRGWRPKLS